MLVALEEYIRPIGYQFSQFIGPLLLEATALPTEPQPLPLQLLPPQSLPLSRYVDS